MEFREVLESRRAVRSYKDIPVSRASLQDIIEAATFAPSAMNSQPWEFWIIEGRPTIDTLSGRAQHWLQERVAHNPTAGAVLQRLHFNEPGFSLLHHAPAVILLVASTYGRQPEEDCCLAAATLMLAARDLDLGTCWIGVARDWFNLASTKTDLGIPQDRNVVAPITVGFPTEWPEVSPRAGAKIHIWNSAEPL